MFQSIQPNGATGTPERRFGTMNMDQRGTPPAVSAPTGRNANVHAGMGGLQSDQAGCAPGLGLPTDSQAEAATQELPGPPMGVPAGGPAARNPYSAAAAAAVTGGASTASGAPAGATGYGPVSSPYGGAPSPYAAAAASTGRAAFDRNPYSAAAAAHEFSHAQQSAQGAGAPQQFSSPSATRQNAAPVQQGGGLGQFGFRRNSLPGAGGSPPGSAAGGAVSQSRDGGCMPITELSPYTNGRWRIKARVLTKSDVRKFNNARGEGQLFKIDLTDKSGGEISATFFGRSVDKYFEMIQTKQVYYFSRGSVKNGNPRFDKGQHVITFDDNTVVEPAEEDREIGGVNWAFVPLAQVESSEVNTNIDVKAIISDVREIFNVNLRSGGEKAKREVVLWDDSGADGSTFVEMTVWGQSAHENFEVGTVFYGKGCRVSEWNNAKSLNCGSHYELSPDSREAFALLAKYNEKRPQVQMGMSRPSKMPSGGRKTIEECREEDLQLGPPVQPGQPFDPSGPRSMNRHFILATITQIPVDRPPFYQACPEIVERPGRDGRPGNKMTCNRKTMQDGEVWRCNQGHVCQRPTHRYLCTRTQVCDQTGSLEVSMFDEAGRSIFGCEADQIADCWDNPLREAELEQMMKRSNWKRVVLRVSSKKETWQDEERVKTVIEEAQQPTYGKEAHRLLAEVKAALEAPA